MEEQCNHLVCWENMETDILVQIFKNLDIFQLTSGLDSVCSSWRKACCDPILWKTIDLSMLRSNFIKIPLGPYVYVDGPSDKYLSRVLEAAMRLSRQSTTTLIFHFHLYLSDDQLTYTAKRCPNLRRLVMPAWNRIKKSGICEAIRKWNDLESLTMPSIANPGYLMMEIANNCANFRELKIMGPFDNAFASTICFYLPNLKVLSLRCSAVAKDALITILDSLKKLEVLNISHSLILNGMPTSSTNVVTTLDRNIHEKAMRLKQFIICMKDSCVMCERTRIDEGLLRWYKYEEGCWKEDEVESLRL